MDADDYSEYERSRLEGLGVATLPVSEIENLFLLPDVSSAILEEDSFAGAELQTRLDLLKQSVFTEVARPGAVDEVVLRYCRRRIDRTLKKIDLKGALTVADLAMAYAERTKFLDVEAIAKEARDRINEAIKNSDLPILLANFDNKTLLALAGKHLKDIKSKVAFESWLVRNMRDSKATRVKAAISKALPKITAI